VAATALGTIIDEFLIEVNRVNIGRQAGRQAGKSLASFSNLLSQLDVLSLILVPDDGRIRLPSALASSASRPHRLQNFAVADGH
jgi:hypothetical protein